MDLTNLLLVVLGLASLILGVWALVDLWRSPNSVGAKIGWTIGILLLTIVFAVLYLISRPSSRMQQEAYESPVARKDIVGDYKDD